MISSNSNFETAAVSKSLPVPMITESRPVLKRESQDDKVIALPRVGGLHHKYAWEKAA
jgi:hypothetical protein